MLWPTAPMKRVRPQPAFAEQSGCLAYRAVVNRAECSLVRRWALIVARLIVLPRLYRTCVPHLQPGNYIPDEPWMPRLKQLARTAVRNYIVPFYRRSVRRVTVADIGDARQE